MSSGSSRASRASRLTPGLALGIVVAVRAVNSARLLATGFRAVSDDDYARAVIAQAWSASPRLDPSGTSWLPLPFWVTGLAMRVFGPSLDVARAVAFVLGLASSALFFVAARRITGQTSHALASAVAATVFPWSAWLGVAMVPELPTTALCLFACATLAMQGGGEPRERLLGACALFAATLSRYEAWPVAMAFSAFTLFDGVRSERHRPLLLTAAALSLLAPLLWVLWNAHAHGDALHFVARVVSYRRAWVARAGAVTELVPYYPLAIVRAQGPFLVAIAVGGVICWLRLRGRLPTIVASWSRPLVVTAVQLLALAVALARDGAPTHDHERAVLLALVTVAMVAGHFLGLFLCEGRFEFALALAFAALAAHLVQGGRSPVPVRPRFDARLDQERIGRHVASTALPGERLLVEVEDYGHLAVIAAFGRPDAAVPDRSIDPRGMPAPSSFGEVASLRSRVAEVAPRFVVGHPTAIAREALGAPDFIEGAWAAWSLTGASPATNVGAQ